MKIQKTTAASALALGLIVSGSAHAAGVWTNWGTISQLETYGDDTHVFGLNLSANPSGCSDTSLAKVSYHLTLTRKEELREVLMAAFLAGRQVQGKMEESYCEGNFVATYGVRVK